MQKKKKIILLLIIAIISIGGLIFQFVRIAKASPAAPSPGHTWSQMECDSNLCVNTTSSMVGIGTTSPAQKLDVDGSVKASGNLETTGNISANKWKGCKKVYPSQNGCPTGFYPAALMETGAANIWPSSIPSDKTIICCGAY